MQQIKRQVQLGNLELARLDDRNQPVPIQYNDLKSTQETRNNYAQLLNKLKDLSNEDKFEYVNVKKLHANQLCKQKEWAKAMDLYLEAMLGIDIKEKDQERLKIINFEQKYPILLNLVTCNYQLKNYKVALELCDKILQEKHGKNHVKALYKKANCLVALAELDKAQQRYALYSDLAMQMLKLKNQESQAASTRNDISRHNIINLIDEINKKRKNDKEVYQRIFNPKEDQEEEPLKGKEEEELLVYNYGLKERCKDFCKELYEKLRSCFTRKKDGPKEQ